MKSLFVAGSVIGIGMLVGCGAGPSKQALNVLRAGDTGYISVDGDSIVCVSGDDRIHQELIAFSRAGNRRAMAQMVNDGRVLACSSGTKVTVVNPDALSSKVRIDDGVHAGKHGIVPNEWLHK